MYNAGPTKEFCGIGAVMSGNLKEVGDSRRSREKALAGPISGGVIWYVADDSIHRRVADNQIYAIRGIQSIGGEAGKSLNGFNSSTIIEN